MRSSRRGVVGFALPTGLLLLLLAAPAGAQNLLTNPDFTEGVQGWNVADLTTVAGFPVVGGVDLETTNPGAGGISQCLDDKIWLPGVANVRTGFTVRLAEANPSGIIIGLLSQYAKPDCTGEVVAPGDLLEPRVDVSESPGTGPILLAGVASYHPESASARFQVFAAQPNPPTPFKFNVSNAFVLPDDDSPPEPKPDLRIIFEVDLFDPVEDVPHIRSGESVPLSLFSVENIGDAPTTGPWTVTVTVPPGSRIACDPRSPGECSGEATNTVTLVLNAVVQPGEKVSFVQYLEAPVGELDIDISVSASGDMNPLNDTAVGEIMVFPPRESTRVSDDQPQTTSGRSRP